MLKQFLAIITAHGNGVVGKSNKLVVRSDESLEHRRIKREHMLCYKDITTAKHAFKGVLLVA